MMSKRALVLSGFLVIVLVLAVSSCRETSETQNPMVAPTLSGEDPEVMHLGGTWYAKTIPGTDSYDIYEVHYCLAGEQTMRAYEELISLEESGVIGEEDELESRWILSEEGISEEELMQRQTRLLMEIETERKPIVPKPANCDCDAIYVSWACAKWCCGAR